ncbi:MAG: zf-TFIIB domain-containing protein [Ilumatobacteraceae bacterium]
MKCPIDTQVDLVMTDRQGIEIDYCPTCRGVWLDRGELDKLIERAAATLPRPAAAAAPLPAPSPEQAYAPRPRDDYWDDDSDRIPYPNKKHKKRRGFLGEMFDF